MNFEVGRMSNLASCKFATFCGAVTAKLGCFSYRGQTSLTEVPRTTASKPLFSFRFFKRRHQGQCLCRRECWGNTTASLSSAHAAFTEGVSPLFSSLTDDGGLPDESLQRSAQVSCSSMSHSCFYVVCQNPVLNITYSNQS